MTAVQQFWLIENELILSSTPYPVIAGEDSGVAGSVAASSFSVTDIEIEGVSGDSSPTQWFTQLRVNDYQSPADDFAQGASQPLAFSTVSTLISYQAPTPDDFGIGTSDPIAFAVQTVVVLFAPPPDTSDTASASSTPQAFTIS